MKRKIVSCVLVASLLFSIGCYSTGLITQEEFKARDEQVDITVYTKDLLKYEFSKEHYRIQGDTLSGSGVRINVNTSAQDSVVTSIALADISLIETSKFSYVKTIFLGLGIGVVVGAVVWAAITASHLGNI